MVHQTMAVMSITLLNLLNNQGGKGMRKIAAVPGLHFLWPHCPTTSGFGFYTVLKKVTIPSLFHFPFSNDK